MVTIKSCTDIKQSRKLAEFLPYESADMGYICEDFVDEDTGEIVEVQQVVLGYIENSTPCWSFAALFNVMPQINEWITPYGHKNDKLLQFDPKICKIWEHSIVPSYKVTYGNGLSTDIYDNPVDACVAMIESLHKLNLL